MCCLSDGINMLKQCNSFHETSRDSAFRSMGRGQRLSLDHLAAVKALLML